MLAIYRTRYPILGTAGALFLFSIVIQTGVFALISRERPFEQVSSFELAPSSLSSPDTLSSPDYLESSTSIHSAPVAERADAPLIQAEAASVPQQPPSASDLAEGAEIAYRVAKGDTLSTIFKKHGATLKSALAAAEALKKLPAPSSRLTVGDLLMITTNPEGDEIIRLRRTLRGGVEIELIRAEDGTYTAGSTTLPQEQVERSVGGEIHSSFSAAAASAALPDGVADQFVDLFSERVDFRSDLTRGDSFAVRFTRTILPDGRDASTPQVLAASLTVRGRQLAAIRGEKNRFFDQDGAPLGRHFLRYPVQFSRISSVFSDARLHPVLGRVRPHYGVDFAAPVGTPVRAVADGTVTVVRHDRSGGKTIHLRHCNRFTTTYLHLNSFASGIRPGSRVTRGEVIGTVGMTGLTTGPHLHFGLFDRGKYVDPMKVDLPTMSELEQRLPREVVIATLNTLHQEVATNRQLAASTTLQLAPAA